MTKKVTKLLAVVALATSPVAADPVPRGQAGAHHNTDPWAGTSIARTDAASDRRTDQGTDHGVGPLSPAAPVTFSLTALVELVAGPRLMPSGAPACGNVASRAPQPVNCERRRP